jgi:hypothetical protein
MRIIKLAAAPQSAEQQTIQEAMGEIESAAALINKSSNDLKNNQTEDLFKKDGIIEAIQNGNLRRLDQNKVNASLKALAEVSQACLRINQAFFIIEQNGGDLKQISPMLIQALQSGQYSAFQSSMANFQSNLTGTTGTIQQSVTQTAV